MCGQCWMISSALLDFCGLTGLTALTASGRATSQDRQQQLTPTIRREGIQDGIAIYQFPPLCVDVVVSQSCNSSLDPPFLQPQLSARASGGSRGDPGLGAGEQGMARQGDLGKTRTRSQTIENGWRCSVHCAVSHRVCLGMAVMLHVETLDYPLGLVGTSVETTTVWRTGLKAVEPTDHEDLRIYLRSSWPRTAPATKVAVCTSAKKPLGLASIYSA